jgi:hypothetical protein
MHVSDHVTLSTNQRLRKLLVAELLQQKQQKKLLWLLLLRLSNLCVLNGNYLRKLLSCGGLLDGLILVGLAETLSWQKLNGQAQVFPISPL